MYSKFQSTDLKKLLTKHAKDMNIKKSQKHIEQWNVLKNLQLKQNLKNYKIKLKIEFLCTAFDEINLIT